MESIKQPSLEAIAVRIACRNDCIQLYSLQLQFYITEARANVFGKALFVVSQRQRVICTSVLVKRRMGWFCLPMGFS
jgi:hypothetical protein